MDFGRPNAEIGRKMANGQLISSTDYVISYLPHYHSELINYNEYVVVT